MQSIQIFPKKTETSACITFRGSMTVEASFLFPLFLILMVYFLFLFQMLKVEIQVEKALQYAGRTLAVYASVENQDENGKDENGQDEDEKAELLEDLLEKGEAKLLVEKNLRKQGIRKEYIAGGLDGISYHIKESDHAYLDVLVSYKIRMPVRFFQFGDEVFCQRVRIHKWVGDQAYEEGAEQVVYVTPTGKVYHLTKSCSYLDLTVSKIQGTQIENRRNKSGAKYYPCEKCCGGENRAGMSVYITDYGTRYHCSESCSKLKRTVYEIPLSQVEERGCCGKCKVNFEGGES